MPLQLAAPDRIQAFKDARQLGWKFPRWRAVESSGKKWRTNENGTMPCYCPKCFPKRSNHA